jgi:class 3 adenylate cyclase/tetratricopeptide (TPR) repeat protein
MQCPRCQHENPLQAKFCLECGARVALSCTKCRSELPASAKFCLECGEPVASQATAERRFASPESYTPKHLAEKILTSKSALEGERKQVTVLFADVKGSMELLADRDPEEARKLLDPVLERMMEAVHHYEGTVNQVMGDGIMALFGAPLAHEDHAVRACYAALRMQESVKKYAEEVRRSHAAVVKIRVGLNSGEVVVRTIGSDLHMDYTAVGQTTHLAARMEQLADPGAIVITPDTLALVEGYVDVKPLGAVPVKGLAAALEVYEATGAGPARTRLQAGARRGLTRFVGRDTELEQLRSAWEKAEHGHGQVVAVVGEPGIGKSRLFFEFIRAHSSGSPGGWLVLEIGSVSYGKATAYLPVIDLLKAYFQIDPRDDARRAREKVSGKLLTLEEAMLPTLPVFLALLDVPFLDAQWQALDPTQRRQRTREAVRRLLLRESQVQPVLLVFEDLHWVDSETQAVLDSLVESLPTTRILLLVNYRPEYQHGWGSKTYYRQLQITPLPPGSAEELLRALLGDDGTLGPLKRLLIERTEGNPFFLEESARALIETKVLAGEGGSYHLTKTAQDLYQSLQIPATAQAILAARIDRLAPDDKRLLQAAAVVGHDVPYLILQAITERSDESLHGGLARLQAAEFLYEAHLFPDLEYVFKHALTHEVAYGGLLHDRRRQLHAAIVGAMEHHYAGRLNEQAERLAHHAVRGEAWEKAVTHLWQAGRTARARSAYRDAVAFLEQALHALTWLPDTVENAVLAIDLICRDLSDPLWILAETQRLIKHLREAARLAEKVGDRARLANVLARTLGPLHVVGQYDQAVEIGPRALALAQEVGDARLNALVRMELSSGHVLAGDARLAEALLTQALLALDSLPAGTSDPDSVWLRRMILENLVRVLTTTGRYREAVRHGEEALRMAEDLGHSAPIAWTLGRLGRAYSCRGDVNKAIDLCSRSLSLARERDIHNVIQWSSTSLGVAYMLAGRTTEAVARLEEAAADGESTSSLDPYTLVSLGQAYLSAGRWEDASRCAREALAMCRQRRDVEADALHMIGDLAARREPPDSEEAITHYRQALTLADKRGLRPLAAHCNLGLGRLYRRMGQREQAHEHLTTATTMYREMDMPFWLEEAEAEVRELS